MGSQKDNKYIVYHHNDHDGIVAAAIFYRWYEDKILFEDEEATIEFKMIDYTVELDFSDIDLRYTTIVFLDYSFTNEKNILALNKLIHEYYDYTDHILWIDHHVSSYNSLQKITECFMQYVIKPGICGALLTYLYLTCGTRENIHELLQEKDQILIDTAIRSADVPRFLRYIDDYDCWKKLYKDTNYLHYGFNVIDPTDPIFLQLLTVGPDQQELIDSFIKDGKAIMSHNTFEDKNYHIDMYGFEVTFHNYKAYVLNRKGNSLMFNSLIDDYDIVIPCYYNGQTGKWVYSIFTTSDNIDCEEIARKYGGGGHQKAAGFQTDTFIFQKRTQKDSNDIPDYITEIIDGKTVLYKLEKVLDHHPKTS